MEEIWKPIEGYIGYYEVSSLGNVRSIDRMIRHSTTGNRFLKAGMDRKITYNQGYAHVRLCMHSKCKTMKVHRMVMLAFVGPSELDVNHIDGVKANNKLDNLEYCTRKENIDHAFKLGLMSSKGERNGRSLLTLLKVDMILTLLESKRFTNTEIGVLFGVKDSTISAIKTRRNWK